MSDKASNGGSRKVLVADDDDDILKLVSRRLAHRGYEIITAPDGEEALRLIFECLPEAAVLDGIMPGLEGHEVCRRIRADERTSSIPVILLTAKAADVDIREANEAGASAFMVKPFVIEDLDQKLRELLSRP